MSALSRLRRRVSRVLESRRATYRDQLSTTTRFFRNYPQLLAIGRAVSATWAPGRTLSVLHIGGSVGAEALSFLVVMREQLPNYRLRVLSTDVDAGAIEFGRALRYESQWFEPILGEGGDPGGLRDRWFRAQEDGGRTVWVPRAEIAECLEFQRFDASRDGGRRPADIVFCQNVLVHMTKRLARQTLRRALALVDHPGLLVCAGMDLDLRAEIPAAGFHPVTDDIEAIHEAWTSHRLHFRNSPGKFYFELEDLDKTRPDWEVRYASIFRRQA